MRASALHRTASIALVAIIGTTLAATAAVQHSPWLALLVTALATMGGLELSSRRSGTTAVEAADALVELPVTETRGPVVAPVDGRAGLYAMASYRDQRTSGSEELPEGHLATVVHADFGRVNAA